MADFTVLGLFSGIGGLERGVLAGLRDVGIDARVVGMVEGEAFGAAVLARAHEPLGVACPPLWMGDIRHFPAAAFRGAVDLVCAGFPCQPASTAGARRGMEDERWLWPEVVRVLRNVGPRYVFLENVRGLLSVDDGRAFGAVVGDLADLGFDAEWTCLSAEAVGAPHRRERVFILGRSVGDARFQGHAEPGPRGIWEPRAEGGAWVHDRPELAGGELVHADDARREGRGVLGAGRADECAPRAAGGAMGWPLPWPPLPGDTAGWARVLAGDPGLAPALADRDGGRRELERVDGLLDGERAARGHDADGCDDEGDAGRPALPDFRRVDDEHGARSDRSPRMDPDRTDRLRALGNAVVAEQARHAVAGLWRRLHG